MRLLLINPNRSAHITDRLAQSAQVAMAADDELLALTAPTGPLVVRSAADLAVAGQSALQLADQHVANVDAILLGISLDGAVVRLRALHPAVPVVGMTEAALLSACLRSEHLGLLTIGADLLPLYRQRVGQIGVGSRVVAYEGPELDQAFEPGRQQVDEHLTDQLASACRRLQRAGAGAIVLAGAVLCGYAGALAARSGLPVFDGIESAVGQIRHQLALRQRGG